jgi:hypothetical protein
MAPHDGGQWSDSQRQRFVVVASEGITYIDRRIEAAPAAEIRERSFFAFAARPNTMRISREISVPEYSSAKSNSRNLVGSTGLRVCRFRRLSHEEHHRSNPPCSLLQVILAKRLVQSARATKARPGIAKENRPARCRKILYTARRSACLDAQ